MDMRRQIICLFVCVLFLAGPSLAARIWTTEESTASTILNGVFFTDLNTGRAVGDGGVILKTTDKGHTWAAEVSGTTDILNGLFLTSSTEGWAVGRASRLVHLTSGSWTPSKITTAFDIGLTNVCLTGTATIFVSAGPNFTGSSPDFKNLFHSPDGGVTWNSFNLVSTGDDPISFNLMQSVFFVNTQLGFVCGQNDTSLAGKIFRTTDGGASWSDISPAGSLSANIGYNDITFINTLEGWCVGTDTTAPRTGHILHTLDGGDTWLHAYDNAPEGFRRVSAPSSVDAWVASDQGRVYRYDGADWAPELDITTGYFTAVRFTDPSNGWAVGGLRASEGGPLRLIYKYVVDPNTLRADKTIYISGVSTEVLSSNVAISGVNIQPDSVFTIEARSGLAISRATPTFSALSNSYLISVTFVVDPASAEAGKFTFYVTNPSENTIGTGELTVAQSLPPTEKPAVVPLPQGVFNPATQATVNMQVATPGQITGTTASGVQIYKGGKTRFPGVSGVWAQVADVQLELIMYNFNNHQIAYRKKFTADPSGYTTVTLQKVNDLGLNVAEGMYTAVVVHPKYGQIGSGVLVVNYH